MIGVMASKNPARPLREKSGGKSYRIEKVCRFVLFLREHGHFYAALALEHIFGNALDVGRCGFLHKLLIVLVEINTIAQLVVEHIAPIVVGDNGLVILLEEVFLYL